MVKSKGGNKTPNEDGFALKSSQKAYKKQKTGKVNVLQELNGNKSNNYWQWIHSTRAKWVLPSPAQVPDQPSLAEHLQLLHQAGQWPGAVPGKGHDGEINTNVNQTPRTFTDTHTQRLPCQRDREGHGQSCSPRALPGVPAASLPFGITSIITGFIFTLSYLLSAKIC